MSRSRFRSILEPVRRAGAIPISESIKFGHGGARPGAGRPWTEDRRPVVYLTRHDAPRWYCVRTAYAPDWWAERAARLLQLPPPAYEREQAAADAIRSAGFEVFAPTIFIQATRSRRNAVGAMIPARPAGERPLFGHYIFSRFTRHAYWQHLRQMECVEAILGLAPDAPTPLPDRAISLIRGMCDAGGCYHENGDTPNTLVGALLRLLSGPFSGFEGVCDWSDDGKARVPVKVFGRECPITVDQAMVELV